MKPAPFDYHAPERLDEALALLAEHGDEARALAGGQSLVPMMNLRLAHIGQLVDINRVEGLSGVSQSQDTVTIGATTRQAAVLADARLAETVPLLTEATSYVGHFQTRNRGTVGGSLAHADPTAEIAAASLALDAEVEIASASTDGTRTISVDELLSFAYVTTLQTGELIVAVRYPVAGPRSGHAIREIARRHGDFAVVGAAATISLDADATVESARVVVFAAGPRPLRRPAAEAALTGVAADAVDAAEIGRLAALDLPAIDDVQATATYRRDAAQTLVTRVITEALERAGGA
jgi:aerobic carbon-monoxide dehydrogenase medium subunit